MEEKEKMRCRRGVLRVRIATKKAAVAYEGLGAW